MTQTNKNFVAVTYLEPRGRENSDYFKEQALRRLEDSKSSQHEFWKNEPYWSRWPTYATQLEFHFITGFRLN